MGLKMKKTLSVTALVASALVLSGCSPEDVLLARSRGVTEDNLALAAAELAPVTSVGSLPSGSVRYDGVVAASTSGAYVGSLYADITMNVDFAGGGITGTIANADLVDDNTGNVVQNLTGSLALTGNEAAGGIAMSASGSLTGLPGGQVSGVSNAALVLAGTVRSDVTTADTVYGTMTGGVAGGFDLNLSQGEFYGTTP